MSESIFQNRPDVIEALHELDHKNLRENRNGDDIKDLFNNCCPWCGKKTLEELIYKRWTSIEANGDYRSRASLNVSCSNPLCFILSIKWLFDFEQAYWMSFDFFYNAMDVQAYIHEKHNTDSLWLKDRVITRRKLIEEGTINE